MEEQTNTPSTLRATVKGWFEKLSGSRRRRATPAVRRKRIRIALVAILIGAFAGLIELPLPVEDAYRSARAELRPRTAPDDIVIVAIDDETMAEFGWESPIRSQDAALVSRLFEMGATRVVFDRAYASPSEPEEDRAFAETLRRFKGRVWLGATPRIDNGIQEYEGLMPTPMLRNEVSMASMVGAFAPFGLSVRLPTSSETGEETIPSISAALASYGGEADKWYRPDWTLRPETISMLSYADVLASRIAASAISGKAVLVAETHYKSQDFHRLPLGEEVPGSFFHVLGAHTLKSGLPVELGWYPGILAALVIIIAQARRTRPSRKITWASIAALVLAPFVLDRVGIFYEIFPALISLGLAMRGLNKIASQRYENATSLLKLEAAASESTAPQSNVYALKLLNLRGRGKGKESPNVAQFMERIARFVAQADPSLPIDTEFAVEGDTLVWCAPALPRSEIEEHSEGLLAIVRNALGHDRQGSKPKAVLGIDVNLGLDLEARIAHALSACEESLALENGFCISDAAHVSGVERRQHLLTELETAIERGQIELGYQPKVHLQSGQIIGAEALLRWHHPEFGAIAAQEAVMLAEEHDLIDDLTLYIVERAVSELQDILRSDPEFKVSINFCSRTLTRRDVTEDVALILSKHDVPARQIIIEITESILLDFQSTRTTISELVALGVQISIDDFGTGYSNLEYIKQLPSAELKIDRRFVSSIGVSEDGEELVRGTIELAHSMSKTVVAEGVERKETADRLRALGCDMAQGHLYSPAIPARALAKMLKETRMAA